MSNGGRSSSGVASVAPRHLIEARVLGGFSVAIDGRTVEADAWGRASAERLVKLLLVTSGHRLSREAAGEHLWPDADPEHQAANLRKALHFARRALADETVPILAPTPYMEVWLGMVVLGPMFEGREINYIGDGTRRHSMVSVDDVASFAVAAVDHPDAGNAYIAIGGPAPFSWRDAVASIERATGRKLEQRGLPPGEQVPGLADAVQGLVTLLGTVEIQLDAGEAARRFGVRQTTLDECVNRTMAGAAVA